LSSSHSSSSPFDTLTHFILSPFHELFHTSLSLSLSISLPNFSHFPHSSYTLGADPLPPSPLAQQKSNAFPQPSRHSRDPRLCRPVCLRREQAHMLSCLQSLVPCLQSMYLARHQARL
jgi:hypothetical protein